MFLKLRKYHIFPVGVAVRGSKGEDREKPILRAVSRDCLKYFVEHFDYIKYGHFNLGLF